jgi:4-aminobutyrate aminotransferase/(S)-3-amino-2-methylpropionate transaminase
VRKRKHARRRSSQQQHHELLGLALVFVGAFLAIEFVRDRDSKEPNPELATAVVEAAAERGLLLLKSGIYSNCIRVLCPLVLTDAELDEALEVWEDALGAAAGA